MKSVAQPKLSSFRKTHKIIIDIIIDWLVSKGEMSFYGAFISKFKFTEDDKVKTMAVRAIETGFELIYSPTFVEEKTVEEIRFVLIHEIYHCLSRHHARSVNHDPKVINIAADVVVNYLTEYYSSLFPKQVQKPENIIEKPEEYDGLMIYEDVYHWIIEQKKDYDDGKCKNPSEGLQKIFDQIDAEPEYVILGDGSQGVSTGTDVHLEDLVPEEEIEAMVNNMMNNIRQRGRGLIPGNVEQLVQIQKRKENPLKKIKKAAASISNAEKRRTFRRLNRRQIPGIKGVRREGFIVNVVVDVSGSMYGMVEKAIGVILNTEVSVNIIKCDTSVREHEVLHRTTELKEFSYVGGGGTVIQPAINYITGKKELKDNGTLIITDGWTDSLDLSKLHHVIIATVADWCPISKESRKFEQIKLKV